MRAGKIYIGTSGWNYKHWKGRFYPDDLPVKSWFKFYIEKFDTVELNTSFYHLPKKETFVKWYKDAPGKFIYAVKASRYITHQKKLNEPDEPVDTFIKHAEGLKEKLGPILFQLPPGWKYNEERFEKLLKILPKKYRYTFEFRNETWWNNDAFSLLEKYNSAFCIFELAGQITPNIVTADFIYIRLHGPNGKYAGSYDDKALVKWADQFDIWKNEGKDIYCYFDNDDSAYAAFNALTLKKLL